MFIAALFTIAKIWKQPKCPSIDEWIKQLWVIYTIEYYSSIKKKKHKKRRSDSTSGNVSEETQNSNLKEHKDPYVHWTCRTLC